MDKKEENIYREKMIPEGFKDHLKVEEGEKIMGVIFLFSIFRLLKKI